MTRVPPALFRPCTQRGQAMIALISMIVLLSAYLVASALTQTSAQLSNAREERSMDALRQAKAALIAYAASEQWQSYKGQVSTQPAALPCPDGDDDGDSEGICPSALSRVGRLPWRTMGLDDLRDASGERLWYAVSSNFRKLSTNVINSDTQGLLTVTGVSPASNVVAIVFAPGQALSGQNRANSDDVAAYLEGYSAASSDYSFTSTALPSDTFNDRLVVLTQAELMAAVEPVVAARMERDIKPYLAAHLAEWGALPFPALFNDPAIPSNVGPGTSSTRNQSLLLGSPSSASGGLLPLSTSLNAWSAGAVSKISGTGTVNLPATCEAQADESYQCQFTVIGSGIFNTISGLRLQMQARADKAGLGFPVKPTASSVSTEVSAGSDAFSSPTLTVDAIASDGSANIIYQGNVPNCVFCGSRTVKITFAGLAARALTSSSDNAAGWFISNQWYRQTYYAVAPGYLPGGGGSCVAELTCLTVQKLPPSHPTTNDKHAVLLFLGRSLDATARPSSTLGNYLEGANLSTAQGTTSNLYEHRQGSASSINDRAVVISP